MELNEAVKVLREALADTDCTPEFGRTHIANDLNVWAEAHANGDIEGARALIQSACYEALALLNAMTE